MLRSIVVPLDGTPHAEEALPYAERLSAGTGAALHLVRVREAGAPAGVLTAYPHEGPGLPPAPPLDTDDDAEVYLDRMVVAVAARIEAPVDAVLLEGEVAPCLARYAGEIAADGFVLATRAPGALGRMLLGSVADALIRSVDLPVLAVPAPRGDGARPPTAAPILVALDGDEAAEAILPTVAGLASALGARITLLHVLPAEAPSGTVPFHLPGDWERTMAAGEDYLDRIRDRLRRRRIRVETVVMAHPSAAAAICDVADEIGAGLVAMGTRGRSGVARALLGSVATAVLTRGHRPVLVRRAG